MTTKTNRAFSLSALVLFAIGCTGEPASRLSDTGSTIRVPVHSPDSNITIPADGSLTLDEYIQIGIPAYDRIWNGADIARAASVLNAISQQDASQLPRYQSPRSGEYFRRLTAAENLNGYCNRQLPLEQRFPDALEYSQATNQILKIYLPAFLRHQVADSEIVEIIGSQLRVAAVMIQLVEEFLPTLDKNAPSYPVRMKGLSQMKTGLAGIVAGSMQTLTETHSYRESELKRLVTHMRDTFPIILPELPTGSRNETLVRLKSFLSDPKMQKLKPELNELHAAVHDSDTSDKTH